VKNTKFTKWLSSQRGSLFLERHQCVAWTELARQAFEEIEDDSSSSSSSSNSSISSGSSMDMSDVDALSGINIVDLEGRKI
jgi:hypothetical protein